MTLWLLPQATYHWISVCSMAIVLSVCHVVLWLLYCLSVLLSYGYCIVCLSCCHMVIVLSVCHFALWLLYCLPVILSYGYCIVCLSFCPMAIVLSGCHVVLWLLYCLSFDLLLLIPTLVSSNFLLNALVDWFAYLMMFVLLNNSVRGADGGAGHVYLFGVIQYTPGFVLLNL